MDASTTIIETTNGNVKTIRFNKLRKKNAIDMAMFARVTQILNDAAKDDNILIVVLTGTGDFYSSGNDLTARAGYKDDMEFINVLDEFIKAFILFPKLLVAVVNGPAVGIATSTLPLVDLVFASDNAYFYTPFTKLGIVAEGCSTVTFPKLIGLRKATQLLLLNYKMPAKEALECGLIDYLHKPEELEKEAWSVINEILKYSPDSFLATKRLLRRSHLDELLKTNESEMEELKMFASRMRSKL